MSTIQKIHPHRRSGPPVRRVPTLLGLLVALLGAAVLLASPTGAAASTGVAERSAQPGARGAAGPASDLLDQVSGGSRVTGTTADGRTVTGRFVPGVARVGDDGTMRVRGTLQAVVHNANGTAVHRTASHVWLPVRTIDGVDPSATRRAAAAPGALAPGACSVLDLVLGPLDLDLLGLQVHLDKVVLTIIAQSGAGNLLGNLLCAVAGLLDGTPLGGLLGQLSDLLTAIFAILRA